MVTLKICDGYKFETEKTGGKRTKVSYGFRNKRSIVNLIFEVREVVEKKIEIWQWHMFGFYWYGKGEWQYQQTRNLESDTDSICFKRIAGKNKKH